MSENVFLAPCDPENFDRTVLSPVDLDEYPDRPSELDDEDEVRFWGVRDGEGNETYFEKMEAGDLVLFYQDWTFVGTGWIGETFNDDDGWASTTFWQDASSTMIFTLEDVTPVSVPRSAVNAIFGYADEYSPQGLMRVAEDRVTNSPRAIARALEMYSDRD